MIEVKDLYFKYPGTAADVINGVEFGVGDGEIFGFLGPSGAGKSTTQKIIIGLLKGYRGRVAAMGKELSGITAAYYEEIGVGFELPNLYSKFTALENLSFFASLYSRRTRDPTELLAMVGLEDAAKVRVSDFSKGMKMRLNFVRALLNDPRLLFLDEPTTGLDPVNARKVMEIIRDLKTSGKTIFLTTHNMHVADELCDRVAFIVDGRLPAVDAPRELKLQHGQRTVRVEYHDDNKKLERREFPLDGSGGDAAFRALLEEKRIETIHTLEATLEDVFIKTTGRGLR